MLAEQPESEKRKEALEFVERAINLAGPQPGLLDTKGMVLFFDGKPDQAVGVLEEAARACQPRSALLASTWRWPTTASGQLDKARAALQQARAGDLDHQLLTTRDRQLLADLEKKLG